MMGLGTPELIIIFVVALIVFGPRKLPELGRSLGKGLAEFKRTSNELRNTLDDEIRAEERRTPPATPAIAPQTIASDPIPDPELIADADAGFVSDEIVSDTIARDGRPAEAKPSQAS